MRGAGLGVVKGIQGKAQLRKVSVAVGPGEPLGTLRSFRFQTPRGLRWFDQVMLRPVAALIDGGIGWKCWWYWVELRPQGREDGVRKGWAQL